MSKRIFFWRKLISFSSVQFSSVTQSCPSLCDPMNRSTPVVHHQLPEFTQTQVHSQWCHPAISSSVVPFSSCPQSLPTSESFPMSQLFAWGGQSIGVSALASVLPKNTQGWSPLEGTGWISLQSKGLASVKWSRSVMSNSLQPHGHQASPSVGFSRQEYWSGLPFPSPGNFPTQGSNTGLPHCSRRFPSEPPGKS